MGHCFATRRKTAFIPGVSVTYSWTYNNPPFVRFPHRCADKKLLTCLLACPSFPLFAELWCKKRTVSAYSDSVLPSSSFTPPPPLHLFTHDNAPQVNANKSPISAAYEKRPTRITAWWTGANFLSSFRKLGVDDVNTSIYHGASKLPEVAASLIAGWSKGHVCVCVCVYAQKNSCLRVDFPRRCQRSSNSRLIWWTYHIHTLIKIFRQWQ